MRIYQPLSNSPEFAYRIKSPAFSKCRAFPSDNWELISRLLLTCTTDSHPPKMVERYESARSPACILSAFVAKRQ